MRISNYSILLVLIAALLVSFVPEAISQSLNPKKVSEYKSGIFDDGAAEIADYDKDSKKLFFVNSADKTVDVLDLSDPHNPVKLPSLDISAHGDGVNSVAVMNGLVVCAVEADPSTDNGKIVSFQTDGTFVAAIEAGALPDMITFSHDGRYVLCANEGEPNDEYTIDPEGSVTIVDLIEQKTTQVTFESYNDKKASLMNKGVRIFGPNATVAQDLEPEYIAVNHENTLAYVSCQENNAVVVIDLETKEVKDIFCVGYKNHMLGDVNLDEYYINSVPGFPELGTPVYEGGETVMLGGFSGLWFDESESESDNYVFYTIPDRGPNDGPVAKADVGTSQNLRPFKLPDYQSRIVKFEIDPNTQTITMDPNDQILLTQKDGTTPISGRGNIPGFDEVPVTYTDAVHYPNVDFTHPTTNVEYHQLPYDPYGGDFEGILRDNEGNFWMCDEYRPAIYKFAPNGQLIERFVPQGASKLGDQEQAEGYYGAETLPAVYSKRWANRGFEAIAYDPDDNLIFAFIQSPMYNPSSATKNKSDVIRILAIDAADGTPKHEFVYLLERNRDAGHSLSRVDKIGDAVYSGDGTMMVIERDSSVPEDGVNGKKNVFAIQFVGATDILNMPISSKSESTGDEDKTLEMMTADDLAAADIKPVFKINMFNLPSIGYHPSDKAEGLAFIPETGQLAVLNDNDFGLAGAGVTDNSVLGLITFSDNYSFDASDKDDKINIRNWPTFGMYQADAIASYYNGQNYYLFANEGDARDYDEYSEEARVKDLTLDPMFFGEIEELQKDENLGRLKTTTANGDIDGDGENEIIFSYGARSFSIFDEYGNLVYDSGNDFEVTTSEVYPDDFNSTDNENDSFDNRSDDKGPEPEGIVVGKINNDWYAFIGLERIGGVMVYEITDVYDVKYVTYFNDRNFDYEFDPDNVTEEDMENIGEMAPEGLVFISAEDSPIAGIPLLITSNEVSGSVGIWDLTGTVSVEENDEPLKLGANYPNPFSQSTTIDFFMEAPGRVDLKIVDENGRVVAQQNKIYGKGLHFFEFVAEGLSSGVYICNISDGKNSKTIKMILSK
jgi:DNA-binding beta-propeller fold protein YncE